ncbi:MAG: hypothetical protein IH830_07360 [Planctomycetes bacterium]|nr:hypothetical protein [Planctomycetota bacterium]
MIYSLVALMVTSVVAGVVLYGRAARGMEQRIVQTRAEVRRFQSQIMLQAGLEQAELTERGYPAAVDPEWFLGDLPTNPLLGPGHPWLGIANDSHSDLEHPVKLTASDHSLAQFWYNPNTGQVRARVPAGISDAAALGLYNRVNDCNLRDLFESARAIER